MKIMFFGTPSFALESLKTIAPHHEICAVVTKPDAPVGRGHKLTPPPVKAWAAEQNIPIHQPESLKDGEISALLELYHPDIIVVVAYGKILPEYILNFPKHGCINVHASLLPKYRGAAPIQWAIINGERETGVCTMKMDEGLDTGEIIATSVTPIGDSETAGDLFIRLAQIGADLLLETLSGPLTSTPQPPDGATYAPPITKKMTQIDWTASPDAISCLIRGLSPAPAARALTADGQIFKIYSATPTDSPQTGSPGQILLADPRHGLTVAAGQGALKIDELQPPSAKRMPATEYLKAHKISDFINFPEQT